MSDLIHMRLIKTYATEPCPVCGCRRVDLWQQLEPRTLTPFHCECLRCHRCSPPRGSKRYALRAWERGFDE